jgi:hypothetical protein
MQKLPFWQNKDRRLVFNVGLVVLLGGCVYVLYNQIATAGWKDIDSVYQPSNARICTKGQPYTYTYTVDGKAYAIHTCDRVSPTNYVIRYNPSNPSQAITNTLEAHLVIGVVVALLGAVSMLGAVFATNPKLNANK